MATDAKPEPKLDSKPDSKPESKPEAKSEVKPDSKLDPKLDTKAESKPESKPEAKPRPEPNFELLSNPARVVKPQLKLLQMPEGSRYRPIKDVSAPCIFLIVAQLAKDFPRFSVIGPSPQSGRLTDKRFL